MRIIPFLEIAHNDSLAGAGVNEFAVFQVDAHVGHPLAGCPAGEKDQVAFAQVAAGYSVAFFQLSLGTTRSTHAVGFLVKLGHQAGTVRSLFAATARPVGGAYPFGSVDVQPVVVC